MAKKQFQAKHAEIANHLAFLSSSPAYKGKKVITWRFGGSENIRAAEQLSDHGLLGLERERVGMAPVVCISIKRDLIPAVVDKVMSNIEG